MSGVYLHIPFCEHKCIYCDFYSIAPSEEHADAEGMMASFTELLLKEIDLRSDTVPRGEMYDTVFFGGGTPSLLEAEQMVRLLDRLRSRFEIRPDAEITMEANPGTVTEERLRAFRAAGINRVSFGVQSFYDDELKFLTRIHSADQAKASVHVARRAGFDNLNIDLMFALPGQTPERWRSTMEQALNLGPTHISCYSLIVEPHTPLARMVEAKQVAVLDTEADAALFETTAEVMERHGYEQYEVSNFARPGFRSLHNLNYWRHGSYLGFGPSAHSFRGTHRWWNIANLSTYASRLRDGALPTAGEEELQPEQMMTEAVFLGLRSDGLDTANFDRRFGRRFLEDHRSRIEDLLRSGLARLDGAVLRLTSRGYLVCDEICATLE